MFQESPWVNAITIYCNIHDAVCDQPTCNFDRVIKRVANNNGLTIDELLERYTLAPIVFEKTKKQIAKYIAN